MTKRTVMLRLMPHYFALYAASCMYYAYLSLYLNDAGLNVAQIGTIMALAPLTGMVGQIIWGNVGDMAKYKNYPLLALLFVAAGMMVLIGFAKGMWLLGLAVCLFAFFYLSVQPLGDTIAMESLTQAGGSYGPVRLAGSIAYAAMSVVAGSVLTSRMRYMPFMVAAGLLAALLASLLMPKVAGHRRRGSRINMAHILRDKRLVVLIAYGMIITMTSCFYHSYFSLYFTTVIGGSTALLGWALFVASVAQFPFFIIGDKLYNRLGVCGMLLMAGVAALLRWIILATAQSVALVFASQILQGFTYIGMFFTMVKYVSNNVRPELRASGQFTLTLCMSSGASMLGAYLGGQISYMFSLRALYLIGAGVAAAATLAFLPYFIRNWKTLKRSSFAAPETFEQAALTDEETQEAAGL